MRIVGGRFKGKAIAGPKGDGGPERLRPTSDRMREAIFNILAHGDYPDMDGARVLDLFAGTGALGFEALSRGASKVLFVDEGAQSRALIRRNIDAFDVIGRTKLYRRDATKLGPNRGDPYDIVFMDAPYRKGLTIPALNAAAEGGWLAVDVAIMCEIAGDEEFVPIKDFQVKSERGYGEGKILILTRA